MRPNTIADFWQKVNICGPDECWEWQGRKDMGYGKFGWKNNDVWAHRMAWIITSGDIPPGTVVRHICDNPSCCNPAHLLLGTHADNVRDRVERGRGTRGSRQGTAILSEDDVIEIFRLLSEGKAQTEVAAMYGVGKTTIHNIATGRSWAWLTGRGRK